MGSSIQTIWPLLWRLRKSSIAASVVATTHASTEVIAALQLGLTTADPMVAEHIEWALATLARRQDEENKKTRLLIRCIEKGLPDHA